MASAYEILGQSRRAIIGNQKMTNTISGILGTIGTIASFAKGQADKTDTAWDEYEAGYKELGGDPADIKQRGGFFKQLGQSLIPGGDKGFFQMPEGEVRIGDAMYNREDIRKAGSFLSTEAASILSPDIRKSYLERTVPGRDLTTEEISATRKSLRPKMGSSNEYDVDEEFDYDAWTNESLIYQPGQEPGLVAFDKDWASPPPMKQGVGQNPYMPGRPWSPGQDEEYNPFKNLIETYNDRWK